MPLSFVSHRHSFIDTHTHNACNQVINYCMCLLALLTPLRHTSTITSASTARCISPIPQLESPPSAAFDQDLISCFTKRALARYRRRLLIQTLRLSVLATSASIRFLKIPHKGLESSRWTALLIGWRSQARWTAVLLWMRQAKGLGIAASGNNTNISLSWCCGVT